MSEVQSTRDEQAALAQLPAEELDELRNEGLARVFGRDAPDASSWARANSRIAPSKSNEQVRLGSNRRFTRFN